MFKSIEEVESQLAKHNYITDRMLATSIYLAIKMQKPLLLEGEPGVGKTEVAKVIAELLDTELIRLQCYEGLDTQTALYEWNYPRQMLELRLQEARGSEKNEIGNNIFSEEFLLKRPLLRAIQSNNDTPPVLLIDEIDRSDEEFEAFLLEVLSDFQITIPELGTIKAKQPPIVILTSNRTRDLHEALKRRCLFHWIDYPSVERETRIVTTRIPGIERNLADQLCQFMRLIREQDLFKLPGVAETLDWAEALLALKTDELDAEVAEKTLGCILKYKADTDKILGNEMAELIKQVNLIPNADTSQSESELMKNWND
ncbi:MAG: MoxR family ATPase [Gammaproteobacteria bacterium]|jgi:MoxR-like ATPase|nr:MoxR family ATPase [Gammaproteobacteria bacterium]